MDITDVDLNLLVVFDALLRTRSVTAAAERMQMSQPAMSFALNRLRKTFGHPLFIRTSRGIHATPYAERLAVPLAHILDSIRADILLRPTFDPALAQRTITFNMQDIGELVFLTQILKRVSRLAPKIDIRTVNLPMSELQSALAVGDVDIAMGYFPEFHGGAAVFQQRLFAHSFICLVRKDHPIAGAEMSRKQFTEGWHGIVHTPGQTNDTLNTELEAQGLTRHVVLRIEHFLAVPMILSESDLIFTVPYAIGAQLANLGDIRLVRPPFKAKPRIVKQYWHSRFHHDAANQWIRGIVTDLFLDNARVRAKSTKR